MHELGYDPRTAVQKRFIVDAIPLTEKPWMRFEVRCDACKWGSSFIMMTVARAFMVNHRCGICGCCGSQTFEGLPFCGDTCIAQGGGCTHPISSLLDPRKETVN